MTLGPMVGIVSMPGRRPIRASLPDCRPAPMVAVPRRHVGSLNAAPSFGTFRGTRRCTAWMEDVEKYQNPENMSQFPGMLKCALFIAVSLLMSTNVVEALAALNYGSQKAQEYWNGRSDVETNLES
ncbi:uncharacterized protein [Dermacentor albipictus]|uniref:uncharacterized protein isoform X2 n=1 Tax=Dermacentor albipictus TaxID=60249 RepID=UPI0038FC04C3